MSYLEKTYTTTAQEPSIYDGDENSFTWEYRDIYRQSLLKKYLVILPLIWEYGYIYRQSNNG